MKKFRITLLAATLAMFTAGTVVTLNSCKKDPCEGETCNSHGTPTANGDKCSCACSAGYFGDKCSLECKNGGTSANGTSCTCATGYEGTNCETEMRTKFIGTYSVVNSCLGSSAYSVTISTSSTSVDKVVMSNMGNSSWTATGTISGSNITLSGSATDATCGTITISGSGSLAGSALNLSGVTYNPSNTTACSSLGPCTETGTKQ